MPPKDPTQTPASAAAVTPAASAVTDAVQINRVEMPLSAAAFSGSPPMAVTLAGAPVTVAAPIDEFAGHGGSFIVRRGSTQRERIVAPALQPDPARDPAVAVRQPDPPVGDPVA